MALVDATIDLGPPWIRTPRCPKSIRKRHPFPPLLSRAENARDHLRELASCLHNNAKVIDEAMCMLVYNVHELKSSSDGDGQSKGHKNYIAKKAQWFNELALDRIKGGDGSRIVQKATSRAREEVFDNPECGFEDWKAKESEEEEQSKEEEEKQNFSTPPSSTVTRRSPPLKEAVLLQEEEEEHIEKKDEEELFILPSSRVTRRSPLLKEAMLLQEEEKSTSQKGPPLCSSITKKTKVATEQKDDEAEEPQYGSEALREIMPPPSHGHVLFHLEFPPLEGGGTEELSSEESEIELSDSVSRYLAPIDDHSSQPGEMANCEGNSANRCLAPIDDHSSQTGEMTNCEGNSANRCLAPIDDHSSQTGEMTNCEGNSANRYLASIDDHSSQTGEMTNCERMWRSWEDSKSMQLESLSHRSQITFQPGNFVNCRLDLEVPDQRNENIFEDFHESAVFSAQKLKTIMNADQMDFGDPESFENLSQDQKLKSEATNLLAWGKFGLLRSENRSAAQKARALSPDSYFPQKAADQILFRCEEKMQAFSPALFEEQLKPFLKAPAEEDMSSDVSDAEETLSEAKEDDVTFNESDDTIGLDGDQA